MLSLFRDGPEYEERLKTPFTPPKVTIAQVHAAIPKELWQKSTVKGLYYMARDVFFAALFWKLSTYIEPFAGSLVGTYDVSAFAASHGYDLQHDIVVNVTPLAAQAAKWSLWALYWHWQGVAFAGWWCLGHEAGHGNVSQFNIVNTVVGYIMHTFLLVPYYAWRSTHHAHHKATGWLEKDENFVPRTRTDHGLPDENKATPVHYSEMFEETPIFTLGRMIFMQLLGWQWYLLSNAMGSPMYPKGTNHFQPSSPLFKPDERVKIIASNLGLIAMSAALTHYGRQVGLATFIKTYFIPYLLANHWIVMLTYLHHSDPSIPHYRTKEWSFLRGAAATVDRPLLGWAGRFFLHNVSHDHIVHHFFVQIPFYNAPKATEAVRKVLAEDYNYDSTNTFRALYRTFSNCCFIEDDGDIVFYKDRKGNARRGLSTEAKEQLLARAQAEAATGKSSAVEL